MKITYSPILLLLVLLIGLPSYSQFFNNNYDNNQAQESFSQLSFYDNVFYIGGYSNDPPYNYSILKINVMKIDINGNLLIKRKYGSPFYRYYDTGGKRISKIKNSFYLVSTCLDTLNQLHGYVLKFNNQLDSISLTHTNVDSTELAFNASTVSYDSNLIVVGSINSIGNNNKMDGMLAKIDTSGVIIWQRQYVMGIYTTIFTDVSSCIDKGYIIGGFRRTSTYASQDPIIIKVDSVGNKEWEHVFVNSMHDDWPAVVLQGNDSSIYVATSEAVGGTDSQPWARTFLHQFDLNGNLLWRKPVSDTLTLSPCYDIKQLPDGDIILFTGAEPGYRIIRTDANGNVLKTTKHYYYHRKLYDCYNATIYARSITLIDSINFAISGTMVPNQQSYNNTQNAWLATFDTTACQLPLKPFNLQASIAYKQATDTLYTGARQDTIISLTWQYNGDMTNKVFMVERFYFENYFGFQPASDRCQLASTHSLIGGYTDTTFFQDTVPIYDYNAYVDYLFTYNTAKSTHPNGVLYYRVRVVDTLTRLEGCATQPLAVDITVGIAQTQSSVTAVRVFPNPNVGSFTVWHNYAPHTSLYLTLYNTQGQVVKEQKINQSRQTVVFPPKTPNGVYFYRITSPEHPPASGKLILNR